MNQIGDGIYTGHVIHKRLHPLVHQLNYKVFTLLVDCDNLDQIAKDCRFFSHNRFNLIALYDRDHGDGKSTSLPHYLHSLAKNAGADAPIKRFVMLCYPRVLGFGFNPLTVYYGLDHNDRPHLIIYEVRNTFGGRKTYVLPAEPDANNLIWQQCPKQFFVSPFNKVSGTYSFHLSPLGDTLSIGVALKDQNQAIMRAHFHGTKTPLDDRHLFKALWRTGWLTIKVILAIHYQALKLWIKGLRLQNEPAKPAYPVSYFSHAKATHAEEISVEHRNGNIE